MANSRRVLRAYKSKVDFVSSSGSILVQSVFLVPTEDNIVFGLQSLWCELV